MEKEKLQSLLLTAYQKQLAELEDASHSPYDLGYEQKSLIPELKEKVVRLIKVVG